MVGEGGEGGGGVPFFREERRRIAFVMILVLKYDCDTFYLPMYFELLSGEDVRLQIYLKIVRKKSN